MKNSYILFFFLVFIVVSCQKRAAFISKDNRALQGKYEAIESINELFLIGDVGESVESSYPALSLLSKELNKFNNKNSAVVFLGDNIYPKGLHAEGTEERAEDIKRLNAQLDALKGFKGEIVFIPGNHDWDKGGKAGFEAVKRQEDYIQDYLDAKVFHPSDGCAGPKEIEVSDNLTLIAIDTQWWLHQYEKGRGETDDCKFSTKEDFLLAFKEMLKKNREKQIVVVGHHPMYSNGRHGGYFKLKDHLFPLTNLKENLYIPLPLVGSIYPLYRSFVGNIQDIPNPDYQKIQIALTNAIAQYDNVIYACGHEHNLQYFNTKNAHYVVSGAGSKVSPLKYNSNLGFGAEQRGFARLSFSEEGTAILKYYSAEEENSESPIIFDQKLYSKYTKSFGNDLNLKKKSYKGMYKVVIPDSTYAAKGLKKVLFGDLNRALWTLPIKVPYLDIHSVHGGLKPIEKGGGQQTVSLKMRGGDGKVYKLREVKKSAEFLVIRELRGTFAQDMVYDGIAGSHPYASPAVAELVKAAELYYIEPNLVYIPKDSILGDYLDEFGGQLAILEVHPSKDLSDMKNFGNSSKIINTEKAIHELQKHQDHVVDLDFALQNRMMDMLIGDWDRHDDQWRWATFKEGEKTIYRPIPRDRDQAFFKFDGVVMNIANRKWLIRKFQPFSDDVRDIAGLNFNARYFDRSFLTEADKDDWVNAAEALKSKLTAENIEAALNTLPVESLEINGEEIKKTLLIRKEKLDEFAERYYKVLAKEVDIVGTTKKDYFEVIRKENGEVEVNVYPRKNGKKVEDERFYHRVFTKEETKEIRLYGLDGKDEYKIKGEVDKSILIRIIGGENKDKIEDNSKVSGWRNLTKVYDMDDNNKIETSKETRLFIRDSTDELFYDRKAFEYNSLAPVPSLGYNIDDGFIFGPGVVIKKHGFDKKPFAQKHTIKANYAFRAEGFNVYYDGHFTELFGKTDFVVNGRANQPLVYRFFGFGNDTELTDFQFDNSQVRMNNNEVDIHFSRPSKNLASRLNLILGYKYIGLDEKSDIDLGLESQNQEFFKYGISYSFENVDKPLGPTKGIRFNTKISNTKSTLNKEVDFILLESDLAFYFPLEIFKKQSVLAFRAAYSENFGDYAFYQANFLSGTNEVRGLPRNRYAGDSKLYGNFEFRKSLLKNKNALALFDFGLLAHYDIGRVWFEDESSDKWHQSLGGGFFINIMDFFGIVGTYSVSDQDELFNVGTQFYF